MKILFVNAVAFLSEPIGTMLLSAICRREGYDTKLAILSETNFIETVNSYQPDVVAYSAMSADIQTFIDADKKLRSWMDGKGKKILRIMGGPHPTYSPEIIDTMDLDLICIGDGDAALPEVLRRFKEGKAFKDIPNIGLTVKGAENKELFSDLDSLPPANRDDFYEAAPYVRQSGLRSFFAGRGCPFACTYCFNHAFNQMFKGGGKLLRRRSVDHLLDEIEYTIKKYPPVRLIRFGDDVFTYSADAWLKEFAIKYKKRINLPFYCLMRSNTLKENVAKLLAEAGCQSLCMAIESGSAPVRQKLMRNLPDKLVLNSFDIARKYGLRTYSNTMFGVPGISLEEDMVSLDFVRRLKPTAPTFGILCPYPGTKIWKDAIEDGHLDVDTPTTTRYQNLSVLKSYTQREKEIQAKMAYLGTLYVYAPSFLLPFLRFLMRGKFPVGLANRIGLTHTHYRVATRIFPQSIPRSPKMFMQLVRDTFKIFG